MSQIGQNSELTAAAREWEIPVLGMSCASCVNRIEKALGAVPGVLEVNVNLGTESAVVKLSDARALADVDAAVVQAGYESRHDELQLEIEGMSCGSCVGRVEKALNKVHGVLQVSVNLANETATIQSISGLVSANELSQAVEQAGYSVKKKLPLKD